MSTTGHLSELDSLRLQVADLSRALAERDQSMSAQRHRFEEEMQDLREQSQLLRTIIAGTAAETGDKFFAALVTHVTSALHVQYAVIGEVCEGPLKKIRTLAVSAGGTLVDNFEYELAHTPCATALTQAFACFDRDVQATFPQFQRLADLGAESYCAVPIRAKGGAVMGLLIVMDTKPLQQGDHLQSLLEVFAPRIAVEFERKRVEQERAQALNDIQNIMETIPDILFTLDIQGNMVKWNRRVGEVTGYSPEELWNKSALAFVPSEERAGTAAAIQRAFTEGYAELEGRLLTKEHRLIPYHWIAAALKNPQGEPIGITGIGRDVSEKKRVKEALKELNVALAQAMPGISQVDTQGRYTAVNEHYAAMLGYEPSELIGRSWKQTLHPDDLHLALTACDRMSSEGKGEYEARALRKDGSIFFKQVLMVKSRQLSSGHEEHHCFMRDISERKRASEVLRESRQRLRAIVEGTSDAVFVKDLQGRYLLFNAAAGHFVGKSPDEVLGRDDSFIFLHDEANAVMERDREVMVGGKTVTYEEHLITADGVRRTFSATKGALLDEQGMVSGLFGISRDITERKRTEAVRDELLARLKKISSQVPGVVYQFKLRPDGSSCFPYASERIRDIYRVSPDEVQEDASKVFAILHPKDYDGVVASIAKSAETMQPWQCEYRVKFPDGTVRWLYGHSIPEKEADGSILWHGFITDVTERKWAEEALRRSERQLQTVLDALPVGVWFTDQSGKVLLGNPAAKQIWSGIKQVGVETAANAAGWWEAIGPSSELHRWALSHALTKGVPSLNETLDVECLDGTRKTIRNTTVPVRDEAGVILGAIVLNEDITELRQAQETLKLTQFSIDHAVEGFFWIGPDARILNVNDAACRMLEYSRDELTAMTVHDIDPNLPPELWSAQWEELKQKGSMAFASKYWSRTGRVLDIEVTVNYLDYEGREYNCAVIRDIGERKQAEASLRQSEERYRSLVDNAPIGIFVNEAGRFVYANREMQRILKATSAEQLIGTSVLERIVPEFHTVEKDRICESMKGSPVPSLDEQFVRLDGSLVDVAVTAVPTSFDGVLVMQVLVLDITERKRIKEALRQHERELRAAVEERERISQDLHDGILQSLFAVGLTLETTKSMMSPRTRKASGAPLDQAIGQLNRVMREIRNFIAGLGSDLLKGMDLPTALQHMLDSLMQTQATRVRLAVEDRAAQAVSVEQSLHLLLVIQEAVSNCIRHGRAREATVSLKMLKQGVRLSIRDNGCGFNPKAATGVGYGLANMAARARKIGGRFTVTSTINEGTRVVLDLPKEVSSVRY